jgi:iron complex transport system permease protein
VKREIVVPALVLSCAAAAIVALCAGPSGWRLPWPWTDVISELRAPRVALSALVGAALAVAGLAMQSLLQNDLADPYVLGLSGGASAGAVTSLALAPGLPPGPAAGAGALGAAVLVRWLARGPYDPARLLLAGVAVSSVGASVTGLILVLAPSSRLLRASTYWLFGGLGTPAWSALIAPALLLVAATGWMIARAERLDRLTLGPDVAASLGVRVPATQRVVLLLSVALTAVTVTAGGVVGFVGLIAPHAARRLVGQTHRLLIPVAALGGALVVMLADTVARTAFAPREVPVGLVAAAVGGPFFLWQLQRGFPK